MIRVFTAQSLPTVSLVKSLLESEGIGCVIRNEYLGSGMGELPPIETWPEVWVVKDHQVEQARRLVAEMMARTDDGQPQWTCDACGETVEAHFELCWNCQAPRKS